MGPVTHQTPKVVRVLTDYLTLSTLTLYNKIIITQTHPMRLPRWRNRLLSMNQMSVRLKYRIKHRNQTHSLVGQIPLKS